MSISKVKSIFKTEQQVVAFLLGNGINLYYRNDGLSWNQLLIDLWNANTNNKIKSIPKGITYTEFYDALEIQNAGKHNFKNDLQKSIKSKMEKWQANSGQNLILEAIQKMQAPLLTTNFDDLIQSSMHLKFEKIGQKKFSDFYPWNCYFSHQALTYPNENFGVWHINGLIKYHRSIKLGLAQYMGNVDIARNLLKSRTPYLLGKKKSWSGQHTWLEIFFNKSLVIVGLALDETEVFLRWLLIERAKYFKRFPSIEQKGYYIAPKDEISKDSGKRFFLNSVGIEIIELKDYEAIYERIWRI